MGVKQSKRSVDISSTPQKGAGPDGDAVTKPVSVEDKTAVNGDATKEEAVVANGSAEKSPPETNGDVAKKDNEEKEDKPEEETKEEGGEAAAAAAAEADDSVNESKGDEEADTSTAGG